MDATRVLRAVTTPVMGCTEPAAVALATSLATAAARGEVPAWVLGRGTPVSPARATARADIEMVALRTVRSLYKNAMAVGIPNAGQGGIRLAAALGPFLDPGAGLNLLKACDPGALDEARTLLRDGERLVLEVRDDDRDVLFAEARVIAVIDGARHVGEAVLRGTHDGVELLRRDGRVLLRRDPGSRGADGVTADLAELAQMSLADLVAHVEALDQPGREHVLSGVAINRRAAEIGISERLGIGVGAALTDLVRAGDLCDDLALAAKRLAAGAADARMSGADVEVMSSSGSGNQGIMAILPIAAVAERRGCDPARLATAVGLSHLVTAATTEHTGLLSALCGCVVKAGIGAAAGLAYLLDAPLEAAIRNMAGNITGEICDGAKVGCAVKICTAAGAAVESALLAGRGVEIPPSNGILAQVPRRVFENIGEVARSMRAVDRTIVQIMERKEGTGCA